ncbi:acyl-CoA dehydrogenase family protein [Fusibacter ferrireducens]|uniref:Acyl-CoA dehydrogenase family protein n=1 Tax=Fusibacter ferrireducens TaxID=2785058 RepID=A0ABR9ZQ30_9FIRM|nr:acyl-CoA dehydrogenase family protein [Fusibacter ferrireducens]MBF4692421.1 acyl-CoA dehydrogenase family protein [Fusibacter ferrireducens]
MSTEAYHNQVNDLEAQMISNTIEFVQKSLAPIAKAIDEDNHCPVELFEAMRKLGLFGVAYPTQYGGSGFKVSTAMRVISEIAKESAGLSLLLIVHWMAIDVILKYGTQMQKDQYLTPLIQGDKIAAYSISEATAGSDAMGLKMTAEKQDDLWVLNGAKYFVTNGAVADLFVVTCMEKPLTEMKSSRPQHQLFIVSKETEGLKVTEKLDKMGCRSSSTTNLILNKATVRPEDVIEGGTRAALYGLVGGRLGMAAMGIGIAEAAFEAAVNYANDRKVQDKPIATLYAIQEKIADMHILLQGSKALLEQSCVKRELGQDYAIEASVAKVAVGKTVQKICYEAVQIMGGHGYLKTNPVERYSRDARLMDIGVGTSEVIKMVIGNYILKKGKRAEDK